MFCMLMCSCKSHKVVTDVVALDRHTSETAYMNEHVKADTTHTVYTEQLKELKIIKETITRIAYDTDKNTIKEVTQAERTFVQDTETGIAQTEQRRVTEYSADTLNHIVDADKMVGMEEVKETQGSTNGFFNRLWDAICIGSACGLGILFVYLLVKNGTK